MYIYSFANNHVILTFIWHSNAHARISVSFFILSWTVAMVHKVNCGLMDSWTSILFISLSVCLECGLHETILFMVGVERN